MTADHAAAATVLVDDRPTTLAGALRASTAEEHRHAETRPFIADLMGGKLTLADYTRYLAQFAYIYEALEARDQPSDPEFIRDARLDRLAAIESDLAALGVQDRLAEHPALPATAAYVERIRAVAVGPWTGYLAHHYTRYLGDLSGGQAIGAMIARHYGATPEQLAFFRFDAIDKPVVYKREYREALDALQVGDGELERIVAEAKIVFVYNAAVFDALAAA